MENCIFILLPVLSMIMFNFQMKFSQVVVKSAVRQIKKLKRLGSLILPFKNSLHDINESLRIIICRDNVERDTVETKCANELETAVV